MHLGIHLGFAASGFAAARRASLLEEAEELGYDSVWAAESTGADAATALAWAAARTQRMGIGSAVLQMPGRSAAMTAMTAAGLDRLSEGRFQLGIGASTRTVTEDWHGASFARQLQRTREYVAVLRQALGGERIEIDGETLRLPDPDGAGRPMRLTDLPVQARVPIHLGAIGPRNVELCGELADGWIPTLAAPEHVADGRELVARGARRAGRELDPEFQILAHVYVAVDDDHDRARDAVRPILAVYIGMGNAERNLYQAAVRRLGFDAAADEVHARFSQGDVTGARAALPSEMIDLITLCGPPARVAQRMADYRDVGVTTLIANPMASEPDEWARTLRDLKAAHGRIGRGA